MKLKYNFVTNEIAGQHIGVVSGKDADKFSGFIKMNDIAKVIFEKLMVGADENEIVAELVAQFNGTESEARETTKDFIASLNAKGLLEE